MTDSIDSSLPRRSFIKTVAVSTATASMLPTILKGYENGSISKTINIGIVGIGGRGAGAVFDALRADSNVKLVAVAEAFRDRLDGGLANLIKKVNAENPELSANIAVTEENKFVGFDAYEKLLATDVDMVILTTPPHFRPLHAEAAIKAGKHVFAEKPLATDAVGLKKITKVIEEAKTKNLSFLVGFCWRFDSQVVATMNEVLNKDAIGKVLNVQASFNSGGVWHRGNDAKWTQMDYQMRNWYYFTWLSGDHIVEQCVHNMDKLNWLMGDKPPISVSCFGGRQARTDKKYGNIYDHFSATYEYPDHVFANIECRHQRGTDRSVKDYIRGTKGFCDLMGGKIMGTTDWRYKASKSGTKSKYVVEHEELFKGIRSGKVINNGIPSVISTGMAIMGRMSAYTGRKIYWDHKSLPSLMQSQLDLSPKEYKFGDIEMRPIAIPGITKHV